MSQTDYIVMSTLQYRQTNKNAEMKTKKMLPKFFSFKEMTYLCNPKLNHYTLLLPKQ